ncbi:MAG: hypothetical protein ACM3ML_34305 [Micromonosporaceae bacterium]
MGAAVILARRVTQPRFANACSVRNALERACLRHANRLAAARWPLLAAAS